MISLRLKNYRCFEDTGKIDIKPINVLLGANSSGKSSFLKFFPLMKQSLRKHTNGLFLWYDDDVDFKDFNNAMRCGADEMRIEVEYPFSWNIPGEGGGNITSFKAVIGLKSRDSRNNSDYLSFLKVEFADHVVEIEIGLNDYNTSMINKVLINGKDYSDMFKDCILVVSDFLPDILFKESSIKNGEFSYVSTLMDLRSKLLSYANTSKDKDAFRAHELTWKFVPYSKEKLIQFLQEIRGKKKNKLTEKESEEFVNDYLLFHLNKILDAVDSYFIGQSEKIYYMQPLRAHAKRYYRYQNVAIDELDSHGDNLAMYLASLPENWLENLNAWLENNFKFHLGLNNREGHVQLEIIRCVSEDGVEKCTSTNLVDTGFGYSQMLPILVQVWHATQRAGRFTYNRFRSLESKMLPLIIAIEQPELHLHPRLVAMFARMLGKVVGFAKTKGIEVCFIIETHSKVLVETLGNLVANPEFVKISGEPVPELTKDDLQVMIINPEDEGFNNEILVTDFDDNGYLEEWPIGFFEGDVY